jgi:ATP-dependent Lhr-like helicase
MTARSTNGLWPWRQCLADAASFFSKRSDTPFLPIVILVQSTDNVFLKLVKPLRDAIKDRGFSGPTEPQSQAIPLILEGNNVLLIAPTGTGKTEAAFLPVFNQFLLLPIRRTGFRILYITPLRALNRDLLERLEWWCTRLDIRIAVRHGDTETAERAMQSRAPPDVLITTPETLQAILPGRVLNRHLSMVKWVIVDEIHELAGDKRGSQLAVALERLRSICREDFQIVGLSATIGSPDKVARFLVGTSRKCHVVKVPVARYFNIEIASPKASGADIELAAKLYTHPEVVARLRLIRSLVEKYRSTLVFTNTRALAEILASRFRVWDLDFPVSIHHGSLARTSRVVAERGFKQSLLKGLICTSSLELGIDIGTIDMVIQYNSPRQVTRLLQRVGRSGHRIGLTARGVIITLDSDDTLEAAVIARRALCEQLEEVLIPEKPLDVLTQQLAGLLISRKRWAFDEVIQILRRSFPYRELTESELRSTLTYMHTRYPRLAWVSFDERVVVRPQASKELYKYYFENLSMIPVEKQYLVVEESSESAIGVLDEAFVAEYGLIGTKFIVRGSPWKITGIHNDRIYVKSIEDPTGAIPTWIGEEIPVPYEVAIEVGSIRGRAEQELKSQKDPKEIARSISAEYPIGEEIAETALEDVRNQVDLGIPVPSDKRITIEKWEDYIIIQCSFGSQVNRTLARLVGRVVSEKTGVSIGVQQDPYRIVVQAPSSILPSDIAHTFLGLSRADVKKEAVEAATKSGLFKRRLIQVARRFGAISRSADLTGVGLEKLIKDFEGTAIFDEALKETLYSDFDVERTSKVLDGIAAGSIEIVDLGEREEASPIARVGLEEIGRKTDLIPPDKMKQILIQSAKARLLGEARALICADCWRYIEIKRIMDMAERITCPKCGSSKVGCVSEPEETLRRLMERKGKAIRDLEDALKDIAETASLISAYGKRAAIVLAAKNIRVREAEEILAESEDASDHFFELILEAEKNALKRRFW